MRHESHVPTTPCHHLRSNSDQSLRQCDWVLAAAHFLSPLTPIPPREHPNEILIMNFLILDRISARPLSLRSNNGNNQPASRMWLPLSDSSTRVAATFLGIVDVPHCAEDRVDIVFGGLEMRSQMEEFLQSSVLIALRLHSQSETKCFNKTPRGRIDGVGYSVV